MRLRNVIVVLIAFALILLGGAVWNRFSFGPEEEVAGNYVRVGNMDELLENLADRASQKIGVGDDFQITVTNFSFPVGTLLRPGRSIPVDRRACLADGTVQADVAPSLFPNFSLTQEAALAFKLDQEALRSVTNGQAEVKGDQRVKLEFEDVALRVLTDSEIEALTSKPKCLAAVRRGNVMLVRGYIEGRRHFIIGAGREAKGDARPRNIGSVAISLGERGQVSIRDRAPTAFLQVISAVSAPSGGEHIKIEKPAEAIVSTSPKSKMARIYVQRDRADNPAREGAVLAALRQEGFDVIPQVELLESGAVPLRAQVRYFNSSDQAAAERAAERLSPLFPDIYARLISLPGPANQLEVWMPRVPPMAAGHQEE